MSFHEGLYFVGGFLAGGVFGTLLMAYLGGLLP